jgi:hypothetical protein
MLTLSKSSIWDTLIDIQFKDKQQPSNSPIKVKVVVANNH